MKIHDKQLRQRLSGFLLRHSRSYEGKRRWTQAFWRWLELERFDSPYQQIVVEEYAGFETPVLKKSSSRKVRFLQLREAVLGENGPCRDETKEGTLQKTRLLMDHSWIGLLTNCVV